MATCIVSYLDVSGIRHSVEVQADSLFEAAALAVRTFRQHDCEPGAMSQLDIEIRSSVTHSVTLNKVHSWLTGGAKSPKDAVLKERLRELLELNPH
jgi:hypothetical protein